MIKELNFYQKNEFFIINTLTYIKIIMRKLLILVLISILVVMTFEKNQLKLKKNFCSVQNAQFMNKYWYTKKCSGIENGKMTEKCTQKCIKFFKKPKIIGVCGKVWFGFRTCECCSQTIIPKI